MTSLKDERVAPLLNAGIAYEDALALRRISMTLHRWHELECGDSDDWKSFVLVRGKKSDGAFEYLDDGRPYLETHFHRGDAKPVYYPVNDRERGAQKRLAKIMSRYPGFVAYVQTDPRGCALYILRPGDLPQVETVPEGQMDELASQYYTRGIAVHQ